MAFTTRPELSGTFGMVASTHWLASSAGMAVLERGGNAFDAAVAAGFALQVVEPHMNGPGGDLPLLFSKDGVPTVLCGQGPAPAAASVASYRALGLSLVPGTGYLAACVPGAIDAWLTLLRDHGTWELADVLAFAVGYARDGFPLTPGIARAIRALEPSWTSSAFWQESPRLRNPLLAETYSRLARSGGATREARIDAARDAWYRGFVADAIVDAIAVPAVDSSGSAHAGVLSGDDLASFSASYEAPVSLGFRDWTVFKTGPWGQGPVFLQQLAMIDDLGPFLGVEHIHAVVEGAKLAFADRDAHYGDSAPVALDELLSRAYADERRALIGERASGELRPGLGGRLPEIVLRGDAARVAGAGVGEPTRGGAVEPAEDASGGAAATAGGAHRGHAADAAGPPRGDTCHLDVADRWGNLVSATPSGGWLQSSPAIEGLGFCLGTRAQMFWLEDGLPASLVGGRRPRTTLSPSMGVRDDGTLMAFGTPGGDQQDQWSLEFFLAHVVFGFDLQAAVDAPMFHTTHFPSSFYPRGAEPRRVEVEGRVPAATVDALRARGHDVLVGDDWEHGRLSAISRSPDGVLRGAANPRGMQGYAVGR